MTNEMGILFGVAALATGTWALRVTGLLLRARVQLTGRLEKILGASVAVLFASLIATSALLEGQGLAGAARPAGVVVAGCLAWRRAPFVVVVLAAVITTAVLRSVGVD